MMFEGIEGQLTLVIMDGVGLSSHDLGNAFRQAHTPWLDHLMASAPFTRLRAHGTAVGMPSDSDMGNSEVGHNALGAGQVFDQGAKLVQNSIDSGHLFQDQMWRELMAHIQRERSCLHLIGLLSDGNVHSHHDHLHALMREAVGSGVQRVRVHVLLDGRDVGETSALDYVRPLEGVIAELNQSGADCAIASGGGRMVVTMDRYEADWSIVERGWHLHVLGQGRRFTSAEMAIETLRREHPGVIDQDLPGFVIGGEHGPCGPIVDGDGVVFFNFRGDRAIEMTRAFEGDTGFNGFDRVRVPDVLYMGMMQYDGDLLLPTRYLVGPPEIEHTLTELLVGRRIAQYAISETQKYGHVTYFWNGNRSGKMDPDTETFCEIPSDRVPFQQRPWMKAAEVTDALIEAIGSKRHRFLRVNYANGDMVGHTGVMDATITAMCCLDLQLRRLCRAIQSTGGVALITADHGNAEEMLDLKADGRVKRDENGEPKIKTSHSLNPVPMLLYDPLGQVGAGFHQSPEFGLSNVAATVAELLGLEPNPKWDPSFMKWD